MLDEQTVAEPARRSGRRGDPGRTSTSSPTRPSSAPAECRPPRRGARSGTSRRSLAADLTRGKVTLSAGARYDYVRIPFENQLDPTRRHDGDLQALQSADRRQRGGHAGRLASSPPGVRPSGRPRSSRTPAPIPSAPCPLPFALGDDPPLEPVKASTARRRLPLRRRRWSFSGSAYYTDVKNDIFLTPFGDEDEPTGSTIDGFFVNLDKTRRVGVEAVLGLHLPRGPLGLPQLLLHPGDLSESGRGLLDPLDGRRRRRAGHQSVPDRERGHAGRPVSAGTRPPDQVRRAGAARALRLGRRRRPLYRQAVSPRRRGERHRPARRLLRGRRAGRRRVRAVGDQRHRHQPLPERQRDLRHVQHQPGESRRPRRSSGS